MEKESVINYAAVYENLKYDMQEKLAQKVKEVEKISLQTISTIVHTIDAKDSYTNGHSIRVAEYSVEIGKRMGIKDKDLSNLYYIALLHDIGKIGVPDAILGKPMKLTEDEYKIVKKHTIIGYNILKEVTMIRNITDGSRYHHERYDGKGYPDGLKGEEIPLCARIIKVADAYDAMISSRAYREPLTYSKAQQELFEGGGKEFDPFVTDIMLELLEEGFNVKQNITATAVDSGIMAESAEILSKIMKEYNKETYDNVYRDSLTNVWNRDYIKEYINGFLTNPLNRGILFMLDLDNFKSVNDIYGHSTGDKMIIMLADTIKETAGDIGIPARMGGDEFVIFFPNEDDRDYIEVIANNIIKNIREKVKNINIGIALSVSIGISQSDIKTHSFEGLFDKADKALYYVKEHGKAFCHFFGAEDELGQNSVSTGIEHLKKKLDEHVDMEGAYRVGYEGFTKIYQFEMRRLDSLDKKGALVLYTMDIQHKFGQIGIENASLNQAMLLLENTIAINARKGDATTRYSDCQQAVIMLDIDYKSAEKISKKIYDLFMEEIELDMFVQLRYEVVMIS